VSLSNSDYLIWLRTKKSFKESISTEFVQAITLSVTIHHLITFWYIYIPPNHSLVPNELDNLVQQQFAPLLLLVAFNVNNIISGSSHIKDKYNIVEHFISRYDLCLNDIKSSTYSHSLRINISIKLLSIRVKYTTLLSQYRIVLILFRIVFKSPHQKIKKKKSFVSKGFKEDIRLSCYKI
jgi:hypothetical protein